RKKLERSSVPPHSLSGRGPHAIGCMRQRKIEPVTHPSYSTLPEAGASSHPWLRFLGRICLFNGFWLIVPILVWNVLFTLPGRYEPSIFWYTIPPLIVYGENTFRTLVILFPLLLSLSVRSRWE